MNRTELIKIHFRRVKTFRSAAIVFAVVLWAVTMIGISCGDTTPLWKYPVFSLPFILMIMISILITRIILSQIIDIDYYEDHCTIETGLGVYDVAYRDVYRVEVQNKPLGDGAAWWVTVRTNASGKRRAFRSFMIYTLGFKRVETIDVDKCKKHFIYAQFSG